MANFSKSYGYNVGKRDPSKPRVVFYKGERRAERYPSGVSERFVNLSGTVAWNQLLGPGVPRDPDAIARARSHLHRAKNSDGTVQGFVEHDKCPLRHGAHLRTPIAEDEFAEMPMEMKRPCEVDSPTVRVIAKGHAKFLEYLDPCPHIQWLIESRQKRAKERREARMSRNVSAVEIEQQKLELAKMQLDEQRKANERLVDTMAGLVNQQKPRKAPTE